GGLRSLLSFGGRHRQRNGLRALVLGRGGHMDRRTFVGAVAAAGGAFAQTPPLQKVTINYPTRTGQVWPQYIAKEGGYYEKYGFDANLVFGVHPAGIAMLVSGEALMTTYTLEQTMVASSKDGS